MSEPIFPNDCCPTRAACCCKDDDAPVVLSGDEARRCLSLATELSRKKAGHRGWPSLDMEVNLGWVFEIDRTLIVRALRNYALPPAQLDASGEVVRIQDELGRLLHAVEAERDRLVGIIDDVHAWAEMRCPCENEQPDPCPLCGELADGGQCRAVEKSFPDDLGVRIRAALTDAERKEK